MKLKVSKIDRFKILDKVYIYNLGKFRLVYDTDVYYMLFGFIPIKITTITGKSDKNEKLKIFHNIVNGFKSNGNRKTKTR